ncbi:MAG: hypothetical protein FWH27_19030 [Planctomycetaceae bacterium]|nr:hypothetical protein [Planctomycetaceae bacterium]
MFYDMSLLSVVLCYNIHQAANRREILNSLELLKNMPEKYGSQPFFACVHLIAPLEPYCFKADGTKQRFYYSKNRLSAKEHNEMYLEQVQFINKELLNVFDSILSQSKREPVIVLMSDHASRLNDSFSSPFEVSEKLVLQYYNNLIAIHLPNGILLDKDDLKEMTNVNVFRLILNAVFHENHPILEPRYFDGSTGTKFTKTWHEVTQDVRPVFEKLYPFTLFSGEN